VRQDRAAAVVADELVADELVALWELAPRVAFRAAVRRHLRRALDSSHAPRDVACLSGWAARTAVDEIARHPQRDRLRVRPPGQPVAPADWLCRHAAARGVALAPDDASSPRPGAAVVVAFGSLAHATGDVTPVLRGVRRRWPDAVVLWSHSLIWPDRARRVRATFETLFAGVDVDVVGTDLDGDQSWLVGSAWACAPAGARNSAHAVDQPLPR
jgi:hypothetical protein